MTSSVVVQDTNICRKYKWPYICIADRRMQSMDIKHIISNKYAVKNTIHVLSYRANNSTTKHGSGNLDFEISTWVENEVMVSVWVT